MTSAPMSASMSVHVGPAMTCVRSITFNPANGPITYTCLFLSSQTMLQANRPSRVDIAKPRRDVDPSDDGFTALLRDSIEILIDGAEVTHCDLPPSWLHPSLSSAVS